MFFYSHPFLLFYYLLRNLPFYAYISTVFCYFERRFYYYFTFFLLFLRDFDAIFRCFCPEIHTYCIIFRPRSTFFSAKSHPLTGHSGHPGTHRPFSAPLRSLFSRNLTPSPTTPAHPGTPELTARRYLTHAALFLRFGGGNLCRFPSGLRPVCMSVRQLRGFCRLSHCLLR